ncbi:NAD-dependent epimerase/dehydratase family protein [Histidinibacterium lentulum]|uniref:NAD-dependent epimerase/dehydratase family protein n=1 Tax=Histidinibacterium lentulum TaxID=2480588 RepID=A0A3N2QSD6_9RHOB|nr:NAD-dependent epimerase/dehydratase family protein [Histidinibacterium lentulum]ROT98123.1 NAD-dependent epimerase/dehydratase family protein [Histidinibacterium lentulum]
MGQFSVTIPTTAGSVLSDIQQTRSFCYVDDLVEAFFRMMETDASVTGPINLGNPGEFTIRELAEKTMTLTGFGSQLTRMPLPVDDPKQRQPDISNAKAIMNWEPTIALDEGLERTIAYFRHRLPELVEA